MTPPVRVALRYFDCRGRAQPLRDALVDAEMPFEDERLVVGAGWRDTKDTPAAGPFGSLPVLEWGADVVAETLPIASYLARRLDHYGARDALGVAELEMVASVAYTDVIFGFALMIWQHAPSTAEADAPFFAGYETRIVQKIERLERALAKKSAPFFGGDRPAVADFFVFEAVDMGRVLLGDRFADVLRRCPRLSAAAAALAERAPLARYLTTRPERMTGSPNEPVVREALQRYVATAPRRT